MVQRTITQAKGELSRLVEAALHEEVVLSRAGKSVVRIVPFEVDPRTREPGGLKGLVIPDDFDEVDPEIVAMFEDGPIL